MHRSIARALALVVVICVGGVVGCASANVLQDDARARLAERHQGELLFVKQSLFAGQFYDDDRYRLVHPRRFEELTYLQNAEGDPIVPPPADEIIPVGTRVRIEKIEWPDGDAIFRRPLFTPRYTTWIFLRVARATGTGVTFERSERHVLLLPSGLTDENLFDQWLESTLSSTDPTPWLRGLSEEQRVAVAQKKPALGMSIEALESALGFPDRISREQGDDGAVVDVGTWGELTVKLRDGQVISWSSPTSSSPPPVAMPPADAAAPLSPAPSSVEPASSEPASSEPASSEPSSSEPASSLEPASSEPASSEPASSEPPEASGTNP
jgi:hypothetical protein